MEAISFTHRWVNRLGRPPQGLGVGFVVSAPAEVSKWVVVSAPAGARLTHRWVKAMWVNVMGTDYMQELLAKNSGLGKPLVRKPEKTRAFTLYGPLL